MDIVHHSLIGGIGYLACAQLGHPIAGAAFLAGSVLPDLDVFFMLGGKRFYLHNHQGPTHSLLLAPLLALLIAWPLSLVEEALWLAFVLAAAGLLVHCLLDWSNTFRVALFWPLSRRRFSLDAIFFIDAVTYGLSLGSFALLYVTGQPLVASVYALALLTYALLKVALHRRVLRCLRPQMAIPSSLLPWNFLVLYHDAHYARTAVANALSLRLADEQQIALPPPDYLELARGSRLFNEMARITRALQIVRIEQTDQQLVLHAADLGVRNFGGRFGRTRLTFDSQRRLIDEMADI